MHSRNFAFGIVTLMAACVVALPSLGGEEMFLGPINVVVPPISTDPSVKYDYDIVYVRAHRAGDTIQKQFFTDFSQPIKLEPGADLMLLHPDGTEELLVEGAPGAITDPVVSFDAQWVYYVHIHNLVDQQQQPTRDGADIYKIHLGTRKIVRLTNQRFTPNTGAANWSPDFRIPAPGCSHLPYGVFNMGPCPLPGGRIAFTSNRDGFVPTRGYPAVALQLFVCDDRNESLRPNDDPTNLEKIGHLNLAGALHPVALKDGRIMFSSLESQGIRSDINWAIWTIRPDGTHWDPLVSAFDDTGNGFHFQTQLTDESVVVTEYYNQNNSGFGSLIKLPVGQPEGYPAFGPANRRDPSNKPWRFGRYYNGRPRYYSMPFLPLGSVSLTPFSHGVEGPADRSVLGDNKSPAVGKFSHPSSAPDNHLLTTYSPGPVNHQYTFLPQIDSGIYLIKNGNPISEPSQMRLIKNDPKYNECWPRAVVPYRRIFGVNEPKLLPRLSNDGSLSRHLPAGCPFGLVGTSSFYKRESYPNGSVSVGGVTAQYAGGNDPWKGLDAFNSHGNGMPINWHSQGADAGLYSNDEIHAVRILAMDPTTDRHGANAGRLFANHANERLRILGEIPLRKFEAEKEPLDPDGNPDTSFLARIPADTAFTFQTLDRRGLVLNMSQTWHQLRPGEVRNDCGGCHAHSQKPTNFQLTRASRTDYPIWDLVNKTPLITDKARDESHRKWDANDSTGVRYRTDGPCNVEYFRDIYLILQRSCAACHSGDEPAGNLNLDADHEAVRSDRGQLFPGTYFRLAQDHHAKFGYKPVGWNSWGESNSSRYIRTLQSRRSLLIWKVFGERLDGFSNDDHPSEAKPGVTDRLLLRGKEVDVNKFKHLADLDFVGSPMPPPDAVKSGKVQPLTDEDRRTIARWVDLGCPIDLHFDPLNPQKPGIGWLLDDQRPTLTLAEPQPNANHSLTRILIGMHDYESGLDPKTFKVWADFPIANLAPGTNISPKFKQVSQGVWELRLPTPMTELKKGNLIVSVADRQGNVTRIDRTFSVTSNPGR